MSVAKILLIEDDLEVRESLSALLQNAHYQCETVDDGLKGLERALQGDFDAVILDLSLPSLHGFDVCRKLRAEKPAIPILILTAQGEESDVVSSFELGSDDYILKPFRPKEVLARLRARLRESTERKYSVVNSRSASFQNKDQKESELQIGGIRIDTEKMRVYHENQLLSLSAREYEVILLLASYPGRPFTREELLSEVWKFDSDDYSINVSVFFSRLRRKIEKDPDSPEYILTVRGVGYRFVEPEEWREAKQKKE